MPLFPVDQQITRTYSLDSSLLGRPAAVARWVAAIQRQRWFSVLPTSVSVSTGKDAGLQEVTNQVGARAHKYQSQAEGHPDVCRKELSS